MSFHNQATPSSSHLSSMADRRILPPPVSYSHMGPDYRVLPPLNLPPISHLNTLPAHHPSTNYPQRYLVPPNAAPQFGPGIHVNHFPYAYGAAAPGFGGGGAAGNTSYSYAPSSSAPAPAPYHQGPVVTTIGSHAFIHKVDREVGKVEFDQLWMKAHLIDLEVFARNDAGEEKGKVHLALWLGIRQAGARDKQSVRLFIAKTLMPYPWFKGDETIGETLRALHRLEYINAGLLAKKHYENSKWYWDKKFGDLTVREFWVKEGEKLRQKVQPTQTLAQVQARTEALAKARAEDC